jgi:hypothetical protein
MEEIIGIPEEVHRNTHDSAAQDSPESPNNSNPDHEET